MQIVHNQLSYFNNILGGSISSFEGDRVLQYDNEKGTGRIQTVSLNSGISYSEYDLDLLEDFNFDLKLDENRSLYFIYCLEGNFHFTKGGDTSKVEALQTVVVGGSNEIINIKLRQGTKSNLSVIKVTQDTKHSIRNNDGSELYDQLFASFLNEESGSHIGTFNLKIKEQLLQIRAISQIGLVRKLLIEGIVNFTLALEILHCKQDIESEGQVSTLLTKKELLRIQEAINAIKRKPEYPYTVTDLSKRWSFTFFQRVFYFQNTNHRITYLFK